MRMGLTIAQAVESYVDISPQEAAAFLAARAANVDDPPNRPPLAVAIDRGHLIWIRALLDAGASPLYAGSPVWHALLQAADQPSVVALILQCPRVADDVIRVRGPTGLTLLLELIVRHPGIWSTAGGAESVRMLARLAPDLLHIRSPYGASPLAYVHTAPALRCLIECGVDVSGPGLPGRTALTTYFSAGRLDLVEILLAAGASPELPPAVLTAAERASALWSAIHAPRKGQARTALLLLQYGADRCDQVRPRPFLLAALENGEMEVAHALVAAGATLTPPPRETWSQIFGPEARDALEEWFPTPSGQAQTAHQIDSATRLNVELACLVSSLLAWAPHRHWDVEQEVFRLREDDIDTDHNAAKRRRHDAASCSSE